LLTEHFRRALESAAGNPDRVDAVVSPVPIVTHDVTLYSIRPAVSLVLLAQSLSHCGQINLERVERASVGVSSSLVIDPALMDFIAESFD
jgi:hypothetical protein